MTHHGPTHRRTWRTVVATAALAAGFGSAAAVPTAWAAPSAADQAAQVSDDAGHRRAERSLAPDPQVTFSDIGSNTPYQYMAFVNQVRDAVSEEIPRGTVTDSSGIRRTRADRNPLAVRLSPGGNTDAAAIDLMIRPDNLYVVGWRTQNQSYWLQDDHAPRPAGYADAGFGGSYIELAGAAGQGRGGIRLGQPAMEDAVRTLARDNASTRDRAHAMTVLVQMVSEAARFNGIAQSISGAASAEPPRRGGSRDLRWYEGTQPNAAVLDMENNWGALSRVLAELGNRQPVTNPVRIGNLQVTELDQLRRLLTVANRTDIANAGPALPQQPDVHLLDGGSTSGSRYKHDEL
ncbi:ribosome-inactivating family protein [Streptomyces luteireticuli]|uniref:Uncharacterized protein n=1 Tax=Streptomyces luteireticuli TaxID=173858 RepID=A0ABN0YYU3_9ACTN